MSGSCRAAVRRRTGSAVGQSSHGRHDDLDELAAALGRAALPEDAAARARDLLPPVVLLTGERDAQAVKRVLAELERLLNPSGRPHTKPVPCARVYAGEPGSRTPLAAEVGRALGEQLPDRTGRLRLPDFWLMRDVLDWAPQEAASASAEQRDPGSSGEILQDGQPAPGEALRNHCYARHRRRGHLLRALWWLGGTETQGLLGAWHVIARPVLQFLPQWAFGHSRTRRLLRSRRRGWYADLEGIPHGRRSLDFFQDAARRMTEGTGLDTAARERLLLRALLADLRRAARTGWWSPWRRRRNYRYVILLELPGDGGGAAQFLEEYRTAARRARCAAVLLVGAGPPGCLGRDPAGEEVSPGDAGERLDRSRGVPSAPHRPLLVRLRQEEQARFLDGQAHRAVTLVAPAWRMGPGTELAASVTATAVVLAAVGIWLLPKAMERFDNECLGGQSAAAGAQPALVAASPGKDPYRQLKDLIEKQNAEVDRAEEQGATARTLIHIGTPVWSSGRSAISSGALPELRGVALAQQQVNEESARDDKKVWLRLELRNAGPRFQNVERVAEEIVREAKGDPRIVGVVGMTQSRRETQKAVRVLGDAGIPVTATTATADEMLRQSGHYRQVAPANSREAEVAGDFAHRARTVQLADGTCVRARATVVIQDPYDVYSKGLGDGFANSFGKDAHRIWYSPDAEREGDAPGQEDGGEWVETLEGAANLVCERVREQQDTIVFWAARSMEFRAFADDYGAVSACEGRKLTVLGGDDLTNAVISAEPQVTDHEWLRLYHVSHVLPVGDPRRSGTAKGFSARYTRTFGRDVWRFDGHAALGYDAFQVMASGINRAFAATDRQTVERDTVQASLYGGISRPGASGSLVYDRFRRVPRDKPLVILRDTPRGPRLVLACGVFAENTGRMHRWGPHNEFTCPRDKDRVE